MFHRINQTETMTLTLGLQYTVDNATTSESTENIKTNAQQHITRKAEWLPLKIIMLLL